MKNILKYGIILLVVAMNGCASYGPWREVDNPEDYNIKLYRRSQSPYFCIFPVIAVVPDQIGVKNGNGKIFPLGGWTDR
jgi:hypothetical protein